MKFYILSGSEFWALFDGDVNGSMQCYLKA